MTTRRPRSSAAPPRVGVRADAFGFFLRDPMPVPRRADHRSLDVQDLHLLRPPLLLGHVPQPEREFAHPHAMVVGREVALALERVPVHREDPHLVEHAAKVRDDRGVSALARGGIGAESVDADAGAGGYARDRVRELLLRARLGGPRALLEQSADDGVEGGEDERGRLEGRG